jgi:hypothetical protein
MLHATLNDRYRVDAELGRGGTAIVYRAHDLLLDRPVAIKVLDAAGLGALRCGDVAHQMGWIAGIS